jgi:hypothetical protein
MVDLKQAIVFGDGVFAVLRWQGIGRQRLVIVENFVEVFGADRWVCGVNAGIHIGVAFFIEIGLAIVLEDAHFWGHDFDYGFPGGFI